MILELALITLAYAARLTEAAVAPLSIPSSTSYYSWYGKDGNWSAVTISIGTPPQRVQLIPSTDGTELWAVLPLGCQNTDKSQSECRQQRGGLYDTSKSSTWDQVGYYDVFSDQRAQAQGLSLSGLYGKDNIRITDSITLEDHLLAGFMNDSLYDAGVFGLGPENTTFNGDVEYSSLVGEMFKMGKIPSLSWSFTAGAFYREKKVYCQVLLGGYDLKRFEPHGISFSLTPELKPLASLQKITLKGGGTSEDDTEVVEDAVDVYIDSTTPYLWLPTSVCDSIADKLGLKWDDEEQLYFYNDDSAYTSARDANYTFTFTLKNSTEVSDDEVTLDLPFEAFDLWHHSSDGAAATRYFPLKRAGESIQYTLGRAFLQETYLIVDYNRVNYTIAQAKFDGNTGSTQDIHPISDILLELGPNGSPTGLVAQTPGATDGAKRSSGSGGGAPHGRKLAGIIAGSVIGGLLLLALFAFAIFLLCRRRRRRILREELNKAAPSFPSEGVAYSIRHSTGPNTAITPNSPIEIGETSPKVELPAAPVPPSYLAPQELDGLEKQELDATGENYDRGSMVGVEGTAVAADTALSEKLAMEKNSSSATSDAEAQAELELAAKKALPADLIKREDEDEVMQEEYDTSTERDVHREADEDERRWLRASAEGSNEAKGISESGTTRPPRSRNGKSSNSSGNLLDNPFFKLNMRQ